jgi:hypothetical protein
MRTTLALFWDILRSIWGRIAGLIALARLALWLFTAITVLFPKTQELVRESGMSDFAGVVLSWFIQNWLTIALGFLVVAMFSFIRREVLPYRSVRPKLSLNPIVPDPFASVYQTKRALLAVQNHEEVEITDCYATLEKAVWLSAQYPVRAFMQSTRLSWEEVHLSNEYCLRTIPPNSSSSRIAVADFSNLLLFSVCAPDPVNPQKINFLGVYTIRVRIDGKFKGQDMMPLVFEGYIYAARWLREDGVSETEILLLEEGDWIDDKRIPESSASKEAEEERPLTKEDFLEVLRRVTRRVPKPSRETGKKRTSG